MTQPQSTARAVELSWHANFAQVAIPSIHWWPDRVPAGVATARLRCLELRVDATPRSSGDTDAYDDAFGRLRDLTEGLLDAGVLGVATRVVVGEPAPPSRLRTYKGLFRGTPELRAGPRLQVEVARGPRETVLVGFEPVDAADGYPGIGGTLVLHPPPRTETYWRGLVDDVLAAYENERGFWQDDTKLVARVVRGDASALLFHYSPDRYWNACLYYDHVRDTAVRWASAAAAGDAQVRDVGDGRR